MTRSLLPSTLILTLGLNTLPAMAQITSDGTLNTVVTPSGTTFTIIGGATSGTNLFHSFSQFSVPTGGTAYFNNAANIANIFSRVTGGNVSNIDGLIRANGNANLFLLNPNGIIFGPNARLNIGGSFIGTTANSIQFADGVTFSATNPNSPPLLSISVPVGLQLGSNSGAITVQGTGHNARFNERASVSGSNVGTRGLQVQPGKTLALVGGNLDLNGGLLSAPGGRIELGSVTGGSVGINSIAQGLALSYANASSFGNIQMTQRALASASGTNAGSVQMQGGQISLGDGSMVLVQNRGSQAAGNISVTATASLQISGASSDFRSFSSLINETVANGAAGNIAITTPRMTVENGGVVLNRTFSNAPGGNIIVNAANELNVQGTAPTRPFPTGSQIFATAHANGVGGNVSVTTQNLFVTDSGRLGTRTYGESNSGDLAIQADTILVVSPTPPPDGVLGAAIPPSLITVATFGSGSSGNLAIDTRTLSVQNGGSVNSSSLSRGSAGSFSINASESIEVNGRASKQDVSQIGAAVRILGNLDFVPRGFNGDAGNVTINTPVLNISNGATVYVQNQGAGDGGTLRINADTLRLDTGGSISASTKSGEGGNISLQVRDLLLMRHGSFISAEAGGSGNGGNISLNAPALVGWENSDIIANAVRGRGGNIQIATNGIFGLKFRNELTPESDITASSRFGVDGIVAINNPDIDPNSGLVGLPEDMADPSQQIASGCSATQDSRFVVTGRGGLPPNPTERLNSTRTWSDVRDLSEFRSSEQVEANVEPVNSPEIVEATGWIVNEAGRVELVAKVPNGGAPTNAVNCTGAASH